MDFSKWRIKKVNGKWWGVFPPSWKEDAFVTLTFTEAVQRLAQIQSRYGWERVR